MADNQTVSEEIQAYQELSCRTLERALREIPFYAAWNEFDPGPSAHIDQRFAALPELTKEDIRGNFPFGFVPRGVDVSAALRRKDIELVETSGTTSEKVTNYWDQRWWDSSERASWQLNPVMRSWATGTHREAILTSSKNVGRSSDKLDLNFARRRLDRFLYLNEKTSPLLWQSYHYRRMIEELRQYAPEILEANPSYLWRLCRFALEQGLRIEQPRAVVFTYELPLQYQLYYIRRALHCPLISSYGTTELGYVFMQCEHGRFHQNTASCRVDYRPLGGDDTMRRGRILVTTFNNEYYQIMRFDPGDIVCLASEPCPCGREEGMVLDDIEGRFSQATFDRSGRPVTLRSLDETVFSSAGPREYELTQRDSRDYRLRFETGVDPGPVKTALQKIYGDDARIAIESNEVIAPGVSGKFRHAGYAGYGIINRGG
ncbi:MAG: hypothetical protein PHO30_04360 [Candidatus Omnitrophica bacterium]|nr:hypothetical protein [Candidatus Omnitrophota bacterium]